MFINSCFRVTETEIIWIWIVVDINSRCEIRHGKNKSTYWQNWEEKGVDCSCAPRSRKLVTWLRYTNCIFHKIKRFFSESFITSILNFSALLLPFLHEISFWFKILAKRMGMENGMCLEQRSHLLFPHLFSCFLYPL